MTKTIKTVAPIIIGGLAMLFAIIHTSEYMCGDLLNTTEWKCPLKVIGCYVGLTGGGLWLYNKLK